MTYTCLGKNAVAAKDVVEDNSSTPGLGSSAIDAVGKSGTSYTSNPSDSQVVISLDINSNLYFLVTMINYEVTNAQSVTITLYNNGVPVWSSSDYSVSKTIWWK